MTGFFANISQNLRTFAYAKRQPYYSLKNKERIMKALGYIGAFLGGAIAGAAVGLLAAPETGRDTRKKIADTVEDFMKKHNIKLNRKDVGDLVDDLEEVAED